MVYVLLEGHSIKQDLIELFRIIFREKEIKYIDDITEYSGFGILVISSIYKTKGTNYAKTEIYIDNVLKKQSIERIDDIEVYSQSYEKDIRVGIKKTLLEGLSSIIEFKTPWGVLTGIRPIKIIHSLVDKDIDEKEIIRVMTKEYKVDINRVKMALEVSKLQRKHIYPLNRDRFSLYISIPFCPTKCLYCSFPSLSTEKHGNHIEQYISTLAYEIKQISKIMNGKKINTVYIGGGTPTAIPPIELEKIIKNIYQGFGKHNIKEITVEAGRPDTITREYLQTLNRNNIDRISINPQTMNDKTLKIIGRKHTSKDIIETFHMAKEIEFNSINMDLIIGLPGEDLQDIKNTLDNIGTLNPENLTIHTLSVKRGSKFKEKLDQYPTEEQEMLESMLDETIKFANNRNLKPYYLYRQKQTMGNLENIGYAKPNKECIYNIAMMEEKETIIGMGMGSVSKIFDPDTNKIKRVPNFKGLKDYILRIDELIDNKTEILK